MIFMFGRVDVGEMNKVYSRWGSGDYTFVALDILWDQTCIVERSRPCNNSWKCVVRALPNLRGRETHRMHGVYSISSFTVAYGTCYLGGHCSNPTKLFVISYKSCWSAGDLILDERYLISWSESLSHGTWCWSESLSPYRMSLIHMEFRKCLASIFTEELTTKV